MNASVTAPPIRITDLVKDYGTLRAVDHVSFEIQPGEIFGLLGPNG
ncbi:MAG: ABC transporter ATP-binding protein, partial [Bdellovibrionota bacterium]